MITSLLETQVTSLLIISFGGLLCLLNYFFRESKSVSFLAVIYATECLNILLNSSHSAPLFPILGIFIAFFLVLYQKSKIGNSSDIFFENITKSIRINDKITILFSLVIFLTLFGDLRNGVLSESGLLICTISLFIIFQDNLSRHHIAKFSNELNFIFIFLILLNMVYVFATILDLYIFQSSSDSFLTNRDSHVEFFLTNPLIKLLNLLSVNSWGAGNQLFYEDIEAGRVSSVLITKGCSGLYSVSLFLCVFISYVFVNYRRFDSLVFVLILFGLSISYFANMLRMLIIVILGHYYGNDALVWSHKNAGWIIFLFWIYLFIYLTDRLLPRLQINNKLNYRGKF